eukprot:GHVQ01025594.1.p1 GENE.GHVQ01025594.1~~GHVQ01025594.1.p1  ORF type:complete len:209 (-),score=24.11 GHVQ01025594.1:71-697(-)
MNAYILLCPSLPPKYLVESFSVVHESQSVRRMDERRQTIECVLPQRTERLKTERQTAHRKQQTIGWLLIGVLQCAFCFGPFTTDVVKSVKGDDLDSDATRYFEPEIDSDSTENEPERFYRTESKLYMMSKGFIAGPFIASYLLLSASFWGDLTMPYYLGHSVIKILFAYIHIALLFVLLLGLALFRPAKRRQRARQRLAEALERVVPE